MPKSKSRYPITEAYVTGLVKTFPDMYGKHKTQDYIEMMEKIAKVESGDKNIYQLEGGPGRGYFQVEGKTAPTAYNRLRNIKDDIKKRGLELPDLPRWDKNFTKLSKDEQMAYAFANMVKGASAKRTSKNPNLYVDPTKPQDMWINYHWAGKAKDLKDRVAHWKETIPDQPVNVAVQPTQPIQQPIAQEPSLLDKVKAYTVGTAALGIEEVKGLADALPFGNGGWLDSYADGSWVADQSIPTPTRPSFYPAGPDRTLTNYQMGTPKSTLPDGKIVDATPEIPAYAHGATVWTKQTTPTWVAGTPTRTTTQRITPQRAQSPGTQVPYPEIKITGPTDPYSPSSPPVLQGYSPYKGPMRLHAPDTTRMAYGGYVPSYGLGSTVGDIGKLFANTLAAPLEQVTGNNFVNFNYANKGMANAAAATEGILGGAADVVLTSFLGPAYGMGKGRLQGITKGIGSSQEYQRGADKWANKTGQLTSSAGNLVAGIASGNPQQIVGGAGELLGTAGSEFNSKALGTIGQLGSLGSMFINPGSNTGGGLTNANLGGVGDINVGATDMMFARNGGRITSKYKKRVGIPYAINPGVSNAGMYVGPTNQRGITFANGGDVEVKEVKPTITGGVSAFYQKNAPELPLMGGNISGYFGGKLNPSLSAQGGFGAQRSAMLAGQLGVSPHIKVGDVMFNPSASVGLSGGVNRGYSNYITDPSGLITEESVAPTFAGNIFSKAKVKAAYTGLPKNYEFDPYMSAEVIKDPYGTRLPISAGLDFGRDTFVQGSYDPLSNTFGVGAQFNFGGEKNPYKYKGKPKQPKVSPSTRTFADGGPVYNWIPEYPRTGVKQYNKQSSGGWLDNLK